MTPPLHAIRHRGPDGSGTFVSDKGDCHLGHVRLSIIDLSSAGHQPMEDASGRYVITFNGEVYNYRDLKDSLTKLDPSINWKSTSDTEVILEGCARQGILFLEKLNGIFALAIFDKQERTLHVLRDPLGIKPMFITEQNAAAYICSELKGLLAIPGLKQTLRLQSLGDQLSFMYVPEPFTLFEEFRKVEPGVCITYRDGKQIASRRLFGYLDDPISFASEQEMVEGFYATFSAAVRRQLIADVPVSLMLSGGLDSSAVAIEAVRGGATVRSAYTISYRREDREYDQQGNDLHYAKVMADRLGLDLEIIQAERNFIGLLPELSKFLEDGISDPAAINTYLICRSAVRNGVKVMLTGQGADEFLGGYRRYQAQKVLAGMPRPFRSVLSSLGKLVPRNVPGRLNATARRINRFCALAGQSRNERLLSYYAWAEPERVRGLFRRPEDVVVGKDLLCLFDKFKDRDDMDAMMRVDQRYDLLSLNLTYSDRLSMAVGVEARVPYLDFDLVRVMNSIPSDVKLRRGISKYVLKKAMEPHLPAEVVHREKAGFGLPIRAWLKEDSEVFRYWFDRERIRNQGIFDPDALDLLCADQFLGKKDYSNVLFSMLCLQIWLNNHH